MKLYTLTFPNDPGIVMIGENKVPLPDKPADKYIMNYGLPISEQKWKRTEVPKSIRNFKIILDQTEEDFIRQEWHKRINGIWIFIKGNPYYFSGAYYTFLNYWPLPSTYLPKYRYSQWKIFVLWDAIVRDNKRLGLDLFKPRRIGATEVTVFLMWEKVSRTRGVHAGMQSKNEDTAEENYDRMIKSHSSMIWFFKPISRGSTYAKGGLELSYPEKKITQLSLEKRGTDEEASVEYDYTDPELGSKVTYKASVSLAYDGATLARYTLNEFGKIEKKSKMDPRTCWAIVRPTMELDGGQTIKGKALFESSIEEVAEGEEGTLELCQQIWDESNPNDINENGMTDSGKTRLFISAVEAFSNDEWGFPEEAKTIQYLDNHIKALKKKNKLREIAAFKRKHPRTIEEVFMPSGKQSSFNADKLQESLEQIDPFNNEGRPGARRANLQWKNNVRDGLVEIIWTPNGRWNISQDIDRGLMANQYEVLGGFKSPVNHNIYRMGVDPYDQKDTLSYKRSAGAFVVVKTHDDRYDGAKYDDEGLPADGGLQWTCNQPIVTYVDRPNDPALFYEDCLMTCHYFSTQMLYENNRGNIKNHFTSRGYMMYMQPRPKATMGSYSKNQTEAGIPATEQTVGQYFDLITTYVERYHNAIKHEDLLNDLLSTNMDNRKYHDLTVAFGWALIAMQGSVMPEKWDNKNNNNDDYYEYQDLDSIQ